MRKIYHITWPNDYSRYKQYPKSLYTTNTFGDIGKLSALERLQYVYGENQRGAGLWDGIADEEAQFWILRVSQVQNVNVLAESLAHKHELVQLAAKLRLMYLSAGFPTRLLYTMRSRIRILLRNLHIDRRDKRWCIRAIDLHSMLLMGELDET